MIILLGLPKQRYAQPTSNRPGDHHPKQDPGHDNEPFAADVAPAGLRRADDVLGYCWEPDGSWDREALITAGAEGLRVQGGDGGIGGLCCAIIGRGEGRGLVGWLN